MAELSGELRAKIHSKIQAWAKTPLPTREQELLVRVVASLYPFSVVHAAECGVPRRTTSYSPYWNSFEISLYLPSVLPPFSVCCHLLCAVHVAAVRGGGPGRQRRHRQRGIPHAPAQAKPQLQVRNCGSRGVY
jgi:hypothetical protein